jgi:hypothetical protein
MRPDGAGRHHDEHEAHRCEEQRHRELSSPARVCTGGRSRSDAQRPQVDQQHRTGAIQYHQLLAVASEAET